MKLGEFNFPYKTTGVISFDPNKDHKKFQAGWAIVAVDEQIADLYKWFCEKKGIGIIKNKLWGTHISAIKGEEKTRNIDQWGLQDGQVVEIWYSNYIRCDNGRHAWIDILSPDLTEIREFYGLPAKEYTVKYHMTIGNIKGSVPNHDPKIRIFDDKDGVITI